MFFRSVKFSVDANIKIWTSFWSKTSRYWSKTSNRQFLKVPGFFPGVFKSSELLPWRFYKFRKFRDTSLAFLQVLKVPSYFPGVFTNSESSEILPWRFYKFRNWTLAEIWAFYTDVFRFYILFFKKKSPKKPPGLRAFWIGLRAGRAWQKPAGRAGFTSPARGPTHH